MISLELKWLEWMTAKKEEKVFECCRQSFVEWLHKRSVRTHATVCDSILFLVFCELAFVRTNAFICRRNIHSITLKCNFSHSNGKTQIVRCIYFTLPSRNFFRATRFILLFFFGKSVTVRNTTETSQKKNASEKTKIKFNENDGSGAAIIRAILLCKTRGLLRTSRNKLSIYQLIAIEITN